MVTLSEILASITKVPHTIGGPYLVCAEANGEPYIERWDVVVLGPQPTVEQIAAAGLAVAKEKAIAASTAATDAVLAPFGAEYGVWETATFDQQYAEAMALMADPAAVVPLITSIAHERNMDVASLAQRIIRNRETWSVLTGAVIGQRLAIVDRINAATTVNEVAAVDVTIRLPG